MTTVVFEDKGTDFLPITTAFKSRNDAEAFVVESALEEQVHPMEKQVTSRVVKEPLRRSDMFPMTVADGSEYIWTLQSV